MERTETELIESIALKKEKLRDLIAVRLALSHELVEETKALRELRDGASKTSVELMKRPISLS